MHTLEQLRTGSLTGSTEVRLVHQNLHAFPEALYRLADTLEVLDLSHNHLHELPEDLSRFTRLRILFASHNPFTHVPEVLGQCPQLEMVGFKACRIQTLPAASLPPRLRWLILTDNQLTTLPEAIGQCTRLQKLMLSCNRLQSLPDSLVDCHQLEMLRLASNGFFHVPAVLGALPHLAWVALAGNPLTLACETQALRSQEQQAKADTGLDGIFYHHLTLQEHLGRGASGDIYRAHSAQHGPLALKVFHAGATSDGTPASELAAGLAAGQHPNVLAPLGVVQGAPCLTMALPLLPAALQPLAAPPSLHSCTRDVYSPHLQLPQPIAQRVCAGIMAAVQHLRKHQILHGDLYAHNLLCDPATGDVVLSDFGAAMLMQNLPAADVQMLQAIEQRAVETLLQEVAQHTSPALESTAI